MHGGRGNAQSITLKQVEGPSDLLSRTIPAPLRMRSVGGSRAESYYILQLLDNSTGIVNIDGADQLSEGTTWLGATNVKECVK